MKYTPLDHRKLEEQKRKLEEEKRNEQKKNQSKEKTEKKNQEEKKEKEKRRQEEKDSKTEKELSDQKDKKEAKIRSCWVCKRSSENPDVVLKLCSGCRVARFLPNYDFSRDEDPVSGYGSGALGPDLWKIFKKPWLSFLDNLQALFFVFLIFCFRRSFDAQDPENQLGSGSDKIRTGPACKII